MRRTAIDVCDLEVIIETEPLMVNGYALRFLLLTDLANMYHVPYVLQFLRMISYVGRLNCLSKMSSQWYACRFKVESDGACTYGTKTIDKVHHSRLGSHGHLSSAYINVRFYA